MTTLTITAATVATRPGPGWRAVIVQLARYSGVGLVSTVASLGLYALLTTTHNWPGQSAMLDDYMTRTLRGIAK